MLLIPVLCTFQKLVRKYKEEEDSTEPCSIKVDAVAKALGPDPRGRVRGLGFGALPSKVDGQTHVTNKHYQIKGYSRRG